MPHNLTPEQVGGPPAGTIPLVTRCLAAFFDTPGTVTDSMNAVIRVVRAKSGEMEALRQRIAALESENRTMEISQLTNMATSETDAPQ